MVSLSQIVRRMYTVQPPTVIKGVQGIRIHTKMENPSNSAQTPPGTKQTMGKLSVCFIHNFQCGSDICRGRTASRGYDAKIFFDIHVILWRTVQKIKSREGIAWIGPITHIQLDCFRGIHRRWYWNYDECSFHPTTSILHPPIISFWR